jgi:hypothetical protein
VFKLWTIFGEILSRAYGNLDREIKSGVLQHHYIIIVIVRLLQGERDRERENEIVENIFREPVLTTSSISPLLVCIKTYSLAALFDTNDTPSYTHI